MNKWQRKFFINESYTNEKGICKISALFNFLQIAATEHYNRTPVAQICGNTEGKLSIYALIVASVKGKVFRPIRYGEVVTVVTYTRPLKTGKIYRDFELYIEDKLVGKGITAQLIFNLETRSLLKTTLFTKEINAIACHEGYCDEKIKPVLIKKGYYLEKYCVRYSDIDKNGHMNNVRYSEIICNSIEAKLQNANYVSDMQIDFISECYVGDIIIIYIEKKDHIFYIRGTCEHNKTKFNASVILERGE